MRMTDVPQCHKTRAEGAAERYRDGMSIRILDKKGRKTRWNLIVDYCSTLDGGWGLDVR